MVPGGMLGDRCSSSEEPASQTANRGIDVYNSDYS